KRSSLLRDYVNRRYAKNQAPAHIWLGVSIEDRVALTRLRHLKETRASVRFVSFEPLLEGLGRIDLTGIHWAIVGGESGLRARPIEADWIRKIRDQCRDYGTAFFSKQGGDKTPKAGANLLDNRQWMDYPNIPKLGFQMPSSAAATAAAVASKL